MGIGNTTVSTTYGMCSEAFIGNKYEFNLATTDVLHVGILNEMTIAAAAEIFLGYKQEITLAGKVIIDPGPELEIKFFKVSKEEFNAKSAVSELYSHVTKIENSQVAKINSLQTSLKKTAISLNKTNMRVMSLELEIKS